MRLCRERIPTVMHEEPFIISFTSTAHENAAMWGLYSKPSNEGIRISCPRKCMVDLVEKIRNRKLRVKAEIESCSDDRKPRLVDVPGEFVEILLGDVLYGGDVLAGGGKRQYRIGDACLQKSDFKHLKEMSFHQAAEMTGFVKSIDWFYEEEVRIVVRLKESLRIKGEIRTSQDLLKIKHLYLSLPDDFLSSLDYTLGPCVPEKLQGMFADKIKGEAKIDEILISRYSGKLKFRS